MAKRSTITVAKVAVAVALCAIGGCVSAARPPRAVRHNEPPMPYIDVGACPFEGCVYRAWTANDTVVLRTDRRESAPIAYTVKKGEQVIALTGVVEISRPGRVQFLKTVNLESASGQLHIERGQTLFLLTYQGEGSTTAWFQGRLYEAVDGAMAIFNDLCDRRHGDCDSTIIERPKSVWWVRVRNGRGQSGWTSEPAKFDGKDLYGD